MLTECFMYCSSPGRQNTSPANLASSHGGAHVSSVDYTRKTEACSISILFTFLSTWAVTFSQAASRGLLCHFWQWNTNHIAAFFHVSWLPAHPEVFEFESYLLAALCLLCQPLDGATTSPSSGTLATSKP